MTCFFSAGRLSFAMPAMCFSQSAVEGAAAALGCACAFRCTTFDTGRAPASTLAAGCSPASLPFIFNGEAVVVVGAAGVADGSLGLDLGAF